MLVSVVMMVTMKRTMVVGLKTAAVGVAKIEGFNASDIWWKGAENEKVHIVTCL